jgi:hypothetical protein
MKINKRFVDRGSNPKENYPFPLMSKGGESMEKNKCMEKNICMEKKRKNRCMETKGYA